MPVLTQLNLNVGTEQNPNMVLHDLHDIRISSTDVNTVTRLLGCDAGVNSIAPLTLANAASLLGGVPIVNAIASDNCNDMTDTSKTYQWGSASPINAPYEYGLLRCYINVEGENCVQVCRQKANAANLCIRTKYGTTWSAWNEITTQGYLNSYTDLSSLASALGESYHKYGVTNTLFSSTMQASLENVFQVTNVYASFDMNFGGADQEGRVIGNKHSAKQGEGFWITKSGLYAVRRNTSADDGTWSAVCIYEF